VRQHRPTWGYHCDALVGTSHRKSDLVQEKTDRMTINLDEHDAMLKSTSKGITLDELENEKLPTD